MKLRFREDRRTLLWAFGLFPLLPALAYSRPALLRWLLPLTLYASYCSGVLAHNHNHCPTFVGRKANLFYGAWLSIFYGFPLFAWVPTHNQNHHRFLNGEGDATRTTRRGTRDTAWAAFTYPLFSARWQAPLISAWVEGAHGGHPGRLGRIRLETCALIGGHLGLLGLALCLHGVRLGAVVYTLSAGLPALLATYFMMFTNYLQHVGCNPKSANDHSRNFESHFWNWFVFDNGLHTVHHEHPGLHWSRYRALHAARASRIDPRLNQSSLFGYLLRTYLGRVRRATRPARAASAAARQNDSPCTIEAK
jgi:fatty acid desaturase